MNVIERPEPEVILDFEYDDGVLYIMIENIGP
jgi:frataxin-like iron-binding protein CyaY